VTGWKDSHFLILNTMKQIKSFRLDYDLLNQLDNESKTENRNLSNYVEHLLLTHPARGGFKDKKPSTKRKLKH
jgi:hypothetical protein